MDNDSGDIKWLQKSLVRKDEYKELKNRFHCTTYSKCSVNNLIVEQSDLVCMQSRDNMTTIDYGQIKCLYRETIQVGNSTQTAKRALIKWYARKSTLPELSEASKLIYDALDEQHELVEDCRYVGEALIINIVAVAKMFQSKKECEEHQEPRARFFCKYKLEKISGKRFKLASIHQPEYPLNDDREPVPKKVQKVATSKACKTITKQRKRVPKKTFELMQSARTSKIATAGGANESKVYASKVTLGQIKASSQSQTKVAPISANPIDNHVQQPLKQEKLRESWTAKIKKSLKTGLMSDLSIKVHDKEYKLHQMVLGIQSKIFQKMFETGNDLALRKLDDFSENVVDDFFHYIYSEEILREGNAYQLFQLAVEFGVPDLKSDCEKIFIKNVGEENALEIYNLAHLHKANDTAKAAFKEIQKKLPELSDSSFNDPELVRKITETKQKLDEYLKRQRI